MAALVLRIKFPVTYPLIYKTLRVDANFTVHQAVRFIAETVNVTGLLVGSEGLYIPDEAQWLDDNTVLSTYKTLQEAVCGLYDNEIVGFLAHFKEHIEFKDRNEKPVQVAQARPNNNTGNDDGCGCTLF